MKALQRAGAGILGVAVLWLGVTWWALESGGVGIIETRRPDGSPRTTHVWYTEEAGVIWIEAGSAQNGWYRDVLDDPHLTLTTEAASGDWTARPSTEPGRRETLRAALRAKYGFRDWWVSWLVDSSGAVPVRLDPIDMG